MKLLICGILALVSYVIGALGEQWLAICSFVAFAAILVTAYNDRRFTNPTAIFAIFYIPYSVWYPLSVMLGSDFYQPWAVLESIRLAHLGLIAYWIAGQSLMAISGPGPTFFHSNELLGNISARPSFRLLTLGAATSIAVALIYAITTGAASKRELLNLGSILISLAGFAAVVCAAAGSLVALSISKSKGRWSVLKNGWVLSLGILLSLGFLVLGERDFIFRYVFCLVGVLLLRRGFAGSIAPWVTVIALVFLLPLTQALKGALLPSSTVQTDLLTDVFKSEFISSSRNTYMLLVNGVDQQPSMLLNDVARGFLPFAEELGFRSSTAWYNVIYRVENDFSGRSGWGFGLVPQGYVIGGWLGVCVVMALVSLLLHASYRLRFRSRYWYVFYLVALSGGIYSIRADIANVISQVLKVGGLGVMVFWALHLAMRKRNASDRSGTLSS